MTIEIAWWHIPTLITVGGTVYAIFIYDDGGGYFSGLGNVMMMIPVSIISTISWIIGALCK